MATILPITPPAILPALDDEWARAVWGRRLALGGDDDDDEGGDESSREVVDNGWAGGFGVGSMTKLGDVSEGLGGSSGNGVGSGESTLDIDGKEMAGLLGGEWVGVDRMPTSEGLTVGLGLGDSVGRGSGVTGGSFVV